jgi:hypothetical protein
VTVWNYRNISTLSTVTLNGGPCDLIAIVVNTAAASAVVTVYDGVGAGTTVMRQVAAIDASATGNFFYGNRCQNGLTVTLSGGTANVTAVFDQLVDDS